MNNIIGIFEKKEEAIRKLEEKFSKMIIEFNLSNQSKNWLF